MSRKITYFEKSFFNAARIYGIFAGLEGIIAVQTKTYPETRQIAHLDRRLLFFLEILADLNLW